MFQMLEKEVTKQMIDEGLKMYILGKLFLEKTAKKMSRIISGSIGLLSGGP